MEKQILEDFAYESDIMVITCVIKLLPTSDIGRNVVGKSSCIYTVHLTRTLNRQTNTRTLLIFYLLKLI